MLTITVNSRKTFKTDDLSKAKRRASSIANQYARSTDSMRIYVSSGTLEVDGEKYQQGSELWMRRLNTMFPTFKAGKWKKAM